MPRRVAAVRIERSVMRDTCEPSPSELHKHRQNFIKCYATGAIRLAQGAVQREVQPCGRGRPRKEEESMFEYGEYVRDMVTGFFGNVTGYADFYGKQQPQYLVEAVDTTGRPIEQWVTANRLEKCDE